MTASSIELPFVRGAQQAGDKNAFDEAGKLESAFNVHIRPEHASVLYRRPGITARALPDSDNTYARISNVEGRTFVQGIRCAFVEDSAGTFQRAGEYPVGSVLSSDPVTVSLGQSVDEQDACGYAERTDGSAIQLWALYAAGRREIYARTKPANGLWSTTSEDLSDSTDTDYFAVDAIHMNGAATAIFAQMVRDALPNILS